VRNTWEIDSRRVTIDARKWGPTLDAQLAIIRRRLGLPNGTHVEARLDKLLIYEAGVTHTTIRRGSPLTLVLTKQKDLFKRDASFRARHRAMLSWLRRQERAFAASS
jgi:hypothetical protein